ncbi:MAG TPA: dihydrofolate reductase family protein [Solirubrobacteraceae bacterium]
MGRLFITDFVSLDGVIEDPGGAEGYKHGGWSFAFDRGADGDEFKLRETFDSEALLLGRRTYEGFAAAWPSMQNEFADKFNSMPKYVVSKTLQDPSWTNTTVLAGDPVEEVRSLKERTAGELQVAGSAQLAQTLIEHDLVDELRLMIFPVLLGDGKRLFGTLPEQKRFKLADSRVLGEGVALLILTRA